MPSSGMLRRMALVGTDVSEERIVLLHSVPQLLFIANVVPISSILLTLMIEVILSSKTSVLTRATRRNISEDGILHIHYIF
jgi:hypothetical protein